MEIPIWTRFPSSRQEARATGAPFGAKAAEKLQRCIMSVGNTMDPAQAYRNFRGRDPQIRGYLKAHGFPTNPDLQRKSGVISGSAA